MMDETEREMLGRARDGDEDAFGEIIRKYEPRIAATITGILGYSTDVEDVGQETFIEFYRALDRFRGDSGIGTYLTRIAINLSLNEIERRVKLERFRPEKGSAEHAGDRCPGGPERAIDIRASIRRGLQCLEPKFRSVIVLRLIAGYSTRETAAILKLPTGTVLSRLARGQARLKDILRNVERERNEYRRLETFVASDAARNGAER
jgi:RNA polymerase sigma-70 factor, ECF subfamily